MSVWSTKSYDKEIKYIVLQHTLKGVNHDINGIKFRNSYAVVEKDSKVYFSLKRLPVLRAAKEYPLLHLKKLGFITRTSDIRTVYGQDVYTKFLEEETKLLELAEKEAYSKKLEEAKVTEETIKLKNELTEQLKNIEDPIIAEQIKASIPIISHCGFKTAHSDNELFCKRNALEYSPSGYCYVHLLEDPRLMEFGIEVKKFLTQKEKQALRNKIERTLTPIKNRGEF